MWSLCSCGGSGGLGEEAERAVAARAGQEGGVGAEAHARRRVRVAGEHAQLLPLLRVVHPAGGRPFQNSRPTETQRNPHRTSVPATAR